MKVRDQIERMALAICKANGWVVPEGHGFEDDDNPRSRGFWREALAAWTGLHGAEPDLNAEVEGPAVYFVMSGDEHLCWWPKGTEPTGAVAKVIERYRRAGSEARWNEVDGNRWCWVGGQRLATTFTWAEARNVVWNLLKSLNRDGLGNRTSPPRPDRWAYKLSRLVPKGDTIRPAEKRRR